MKSVLPKASGLMVNTYYVYHNYRNMFNIGEKLQFRGPIFTDSGGFQLSRISVFGRKATVKRYSQEQVLRDQIGLGSDFAACLDFPLNPSDPLRKNMVRIEKSLSNVEQAVLLAQSLKTKTIIVPVIHGYDRKMVNFAFRRMEKLENDLSYYFPVIAIGSLVPLYADRANAGSARLMNAFQAMLEFAPSGRSIHVMGAGSPLSMRFYYWLGADSLDTRSWVTNAVFGKLIMPKYGRGRVHVSELIRRFGVRAKLCGCPICRSCCLKDLADSRMSRAAHNAFVYLREFTRIKREFENGTFWGITDRLLRREVFFRRLIKYGVQSR
jgi:tRNA-guanine family transglycosylase